MYIPVSMYCHFELIKQLCRKKKKKPIWETVFVKFLKLLLFFPILLMAIPTLLLMVNMKVRIVTECYLMGHEVPYLLILLFFLFWLTSSQICQPEKKKIVIYRHRVAHMRWVRRWWRFLANSQNVIHKVDFCSSNSALFFFSIWNMFPYRSFIPQIVTRHLLWYGACHLIRCPVTPTSWYLCPYVIPSPWVGPGPRDLLPMDRLWQKRTGCYFSS